MRRRGAATGAPARGLQARLTGHARGPLAAGLVTGLVAVLGLAVPVPAAGQDRSVVIEDMHAVYQVQVSGDVAVEERFRVRFNGSWNGFLRVVDLTPAEGYPWDTPISFRLVGATDGAGDELRAEVSSTGRYQREVRVYVPDASDRTANVVLRYTLSDVLAFYAADPERDLPGLDEFYWSVTGTAWESPILGASAEVVLPEGARIAQAAAYQGAAWSTDSVPFLKEGSVGRVRSQGRLDPGEGLSIGAGWPAGVVQRDPARTMEWAEASLAERLAGPRPGPLTYVPLLLPFVVFWFAYRAWDKRGRDPKERAIVVRWEPPEDLSPAEAGTLVDHTPDMHDLISTLVELAVKGYVVIEEREKKGFLKSGEEYVFHLVRGRSEWDELLPHQWRFLDGLFKHRSEGVGGILKGALGLDDDAGVGAPPTAVASVKLSDLKNEFYKEIPEIKDAILDGLVRKGHYLRRPDKVRGAWIGVAAILGALGFGAFAALADGNPILGLVLAGAAGASALIVGVFGFIMPARTEAGARIREAALGFKEFLKKVESPRYRRMIKSPEQFEEYLPYAMAFQCQEEWAKAFDDMLTEPPDWYYGHSGHFHASIFASHMGQMASTAGTAMASSPGGTGSGGGGSVGGASGAGGGGGGF